MTKKWQVLRVVVCVCLCLFLLVSFYPKAESVPQEEDNQTSSNIITDNSLATDEAAKEFILTYGKPLAELALENDLYPSVVIAQAMLNSENGHSPSAQAPNYNFFAIKGRYNEEYLERMETDLGTGELVAVEFRKYPTEQEGFKDYVALMKQGYESDPEYFQSTWVSRTASFEEAIFGLTETFGMSERYTEELHELILANDLLAYDTLNEETEKQEQAPLSYYVVKDGENLWDVSNHFGISVGELMKQNNLNTSKLSLNQEFFVE